MEIMKEKVGIWGKPEKARILFGKMREGEKIDDGEKQGKGNRIEGHIRRKESRRKNEKE